MKTSPARFYCLLLICWSLAGCSQWVYDMGTPIASHNVPQQKTPLSEVLKLLGPPIRMSATDTGFVLAWEHWQVQENSIGITLGALGADFFSADWGEMRVKGEFLLLTFDHQHLLTSATHSNWDNDGGGGQAIQPLFGFVSVVDADDLIRSLPQHNWGITLLQADLPTALNSGSNSDTGQQGLQQRGTPNAIGQQSLELD
jgi:hypothetical protein